MRRLALFAVLVLAIGLTASPGNASSVTRTFPSSTSTVVGSVGFIDGDEVGFFSSAARGDRVSETFSGPPTINAAVLKIHVQRNTLTANRAVMWRVDINSVQIGVFGISTGFTGTRTVSATFDPITAATYTVTIRVTNTLLPTEGSHSLTFSGPSNHSIELIRNSTCSNGGIDGRTTAEEVTGREINEEGPVSSNVHRLEAEAGYFGFAVHEASCVVAATGL